MILILGHRNAADVTIGKFRDVNSLAEFRILEEQREACFRPFIESATRHPISTRDVIRLLVDVPT